VIRGRPALKFLPFLVLTPVLSGCVAAALPVVAASVVAGKHVAPSAHQEQHEAREQTSGSVVLTALTALPAPTAQVAGGNYAPFAAYALDHASGTDLVNVAGAVDAGKPLSQAAPRPCDGLAPAVILDLDPGSDSFDPASATPQPGLVDSLHRMRAAGITVMWASALSVDKAELVHDALARTGLDPDRTDRLILLNGPDDRKQTRRAEAATNWCVVAMAGDRRGDFDELYDYLRDPDAPVPADAMLGDGWFIAPPPLQ
jgi:hypothetical protein